LSDETTKLENSISSTAVDHQQGVKVASLLIEMAKANLQKARTKLASVRDKQRMLCVKSKELIERALPGLTSKKRYAREKKKKTR